MGALDNPKTGGRLLLLAADFLTVLLLTAGTALAFLSGYRVDVDLGAVIAFCVFASAAAAVLHSLSRPWWALASAAVIAAVFRVIWEDAFPVLEWIGQKMNLLSRNSAGWSGKQEKWLMPVLLLLCAALAWLMGWMTVRARQWYLPALLSFALLLPAIQAGVLPAWGAMLAAFTGWGSLLLTALYGRKDSGGLGRARLLSLGGMLALILILVMALPREGYLRPQWATDARNSLLRSVSDRMERFFDMETLNSVLLTELGLDLSIPEESGGTGTGALNTAGAFGGGQSRVENLLSVGPRRYRNREIMELETDGPGGERIYLLGGALGVYTGVSWEEGEALPEGRWASSYPALTAPGGTVFTMTITNTAYRGVNYYPYRLIIGGQRDENGVLTLPESPEDGPLSLRTETYQVGYIPGGPEDGFTPLPEAYREEERTWSSSGAFHARYLDVPEASRTALEPLLSREKQEMLITSLEQELDTLEGDARIEREESLRRMRETMNARPTLDSVGGMVEVPDEMEFEERYEAAITAASRTAELLAKWAVYDLDAPAMGAGEDFVAHFLAEGRGYCVHFATAGAMLLRMQGIPARYAAGYVAELDGRGRGRVMDSGAHAWVEIYLDGYGWYPVEMTPGYAGGSSGVELSGTPDAETSGEKEPEPGELPEEETQKPDSLPEELPGELQPEEEALETASIPWKALGRAALIPGVLAGLYALALLARRKERLDADANRSAIRAYQRYSRALRLGGMENETMEALGRKAKFSQHTLTEEERAAVWQCLEETVQTTKRGQKRPRRWLLSLLRPLL